MPHLCFSRSVRLSERRTSVNVVRHNPHAPRTPQMVVAALGQASEATQKSKSKSRSPAQRRRDAARSKHFKQQRNIMTIFPFHCIDNSELETLRFNNPVRIEFKKLTNCLVSYQEIANDEALQTYILRQQDKNNQDIIKALREEVNSLNGEFEKKNDQRERHIKTLENRLLEHESKLNKCTEDLYRLCHFVSEIDPNVIASDLLTTTRKEPQFQPIYTAYWTSQEKRKTTVMAILQRVLHRELTRSITEEIRKFKELNTNRPQQNIVSVMDKEPNRNKNFPRSNRRGRR